MPQEDPSAVEVDSLPSYVERMDGLITPIVDDEDYGKYEPATWTNRYEQYPSRVWVGYKSRAWCCVEMYISSVAPLHPDCQRYFELTVARKGKSRRRGDRGRRERPRGPVRRRSLPRTPERGGSR